MLFHGIAAEFGARDGKNAAPEKNQAATGAA